MASPLVHLMMFGWIPFIILLFALMPARKAVISGILLGWMFLPIYGYDLPSLPDYTKMSAITLGVLLAALLFDARTVFTYRPALIDLPMAIWCLCPIASSLSNDLGLYDGISTALGEFFTWGIPYFLGRVYFGDAPGLRMLAAGLVVGGLVYTPFCLYEIKMSPQLHRLVYGFFQHGFNQTLRFGGYRPMVFMQHGLAVGMYMADATLIGVWLWLRKTPVRLRSVPTAAYMIPLIVTTILCKSFGAIALLVIGLGALVACKAMKTRLALLAVALAPMVYMVARSTGDWSGDGMANLVEVVSQDRADSLRFRMDNENILVDKALERPAAGWGGWNRARVVDEWGNDRSITDGLWVIALGNNGLIGLASLTIALLTPPLLLLRRWRADQWSMAAAAPAAALAAVLLLHCVDNLFNGMISPTYILVAGGLSTLAARRSAGVLAPTRTVVPVRRGGVHIPETATAA